MTGTSFFGVYYYCGMSLFNPHPAENQNQVVTWTMVHKSNQSAKLTCFTALVSLKSKLQPPRWCPHDLQAQRGCLSQDRCKVVDCGGHKNWKNQNQSQFYENRWNGRGKTQDPIWVRCDGSLASKMTRSEDSKKPTHCMNIQSVYGAFLPYLIADECYIVTVRVTHKDDSAE